MRHHHPMNQPPTEHPPNAVNVREAVIAREDGLEAVLRRSLREYAEAAVPEASSWDWDGAVVDVVLPAVLR